MLCIGHNKIVDLLIRNGAAIDATEKYGKTPLMAAAFEGNQRFKWFE